LIATVCQQSANVIKFDLSCTSEIFATERKILYKYKILIYTDNESLLAAGCPPENFIVDSCSQTAKVSDRKYITALKLALRD